MTNIIFSKNANDLFKNIIKLPEALCDEIYSYIPKKVTIFLNKKTYIAEHNLVKNLDAAETMGGANEICTDKTGTLTLNQM